MGCGDDWPLCRGRLLPPLELHAIIEFAHRQFVVLVSVLVSALAIYAWHLRRTHREPGSAPDRTAFVALGLLALQVALGAVIVKLALPPLRVVLHLALAMLILATLIVAARGGLARRPHARALVASGLGFAAVLLGALTANTGAASACLGFPLCNGQVVPDGNYLQHIHWTHRLLAYTLLGYTLWWAVRTKQPAAWRVAGLVTLQVAVAAAMVLLALPQLLQALHVAVGAAVWAGLVIAAL